jgi:Histidine kinase-, DNA gyrase B-, and HSP90-like ATPase
MGETRVDLLHLLEDLADAYPGDLHETILIEIVANALDSGASNIRVEADANDRTLTVVDNGGGMRRADLRRFHDVATSTKTRGEGIGFAGIGIKLGLLISDEVITESKRGKDHISTTWTLTQRKRAPWRWIPPTGLVTERGTAVRLRLSDPLSPLVEPRFLEATVRQHFEPLLDARFDDLLHAQYPLGVRFVVNGNELGRVTADEAEVALVSVRLAGKRKPSAAGYLARRAGPFDEDRRGVAISTFGKVIKRGWDWLGVMPAAADRIAGLIEAPTLAASLTLNKADFLRTGPRGATFLAYRKAIQEAVGEQLARWGDDPSEHPAQHRRMARPIERDMETVLASLADSFPMLAMLVKLRAGGSRKLRVGSGATIDLESDTIDLFAPPPTNDTASPNEAPEPMADEEPAIRPERERERSHVVPPTERGTRRPARMGLTIQFESRPDDAELARLVETTIWVNDAHPAYTRAAGSRSESYHVTLAVALALSKVAVDPAKEREFVLEFLARWGGARDQSNGKKKRRR